MKHVNATSNSFSEPSTPNLHFAKMRRSACRTLCAALLTISMVVGAQAAAPREESGFGSNPGNLRMFSYVPGSLPPGAALIVVLHGCKQRAVTFARDAGWLALADRSRLALLLPEQKGLPSFFARRFSVPVGAGAMGSEQPERLL
jgi:poly(3-hydroxybutyrate) depolymerase